MESTNKATRVALVNPPLAEYNSHHPLVPPLGLAYLAAVLEKNNFEVKIMDCPVCKTDHQKLKEDLAAFQPSLIGIASMTPTINSALKSARAAKEVCPSAKVILGSPHATFAGELILTEEPMVDVVVRGEGEETLLELAQNLPKIDALDKIKGITYRKNNRIEFNSDRPFIQNLDDLPRPAYHLIPMEKYSIYGSKFLPIMTSRGCPFRCSFCVDTQMFGAQFRSRSPKSVVDELEWLRDEHGAEGLSFHDDTLTLDKKRIMDICDLIISRKIGLPWGCLTRADQVSKEILAKMRKANCNEVSFGVESGCQRILDAVGKKVKIEQCERAIKWAKEEGFFVAASTIIGYPGETKETMKQTLDLLRKMEPDDAWLCIATPYLGTELRALVERNGWKINNDWNLYDTMHTIFENPDVTAKDMDDMRRNFYNSYYSPKYIFKQSVKGYIRGNYYSRIMARASLNYLLWRLKSRF